MCLNRRLSSFLALLHVINWAHQQLDKLEWWIRPLCIDTNIWSIKILDSTLSLQKYAAVKDKRRGCFEWYLFFWWKMKGRVFVAYLQAKIQEGVSTKRVVQLSSLKCWTESNFPHIIIHDSCFKGLNTRTLLQKQTDAKRQSLWITVIYATWPWKALRKTAFEFLCHSDKPPTVHVPPGLHKAVWTNVTSSTSQQHHLPVVAKDQGQGNFF